MEYVLTTNFGVMNVRIILKAGAVPVSKKRWARDL